MMKINIKEPTEIIYCKIPLYEILLYEKFDK